MFINLKVFAENSQKIAPSFLAPDVHKKSDNKIPVFKIIGAFMIDFFIILGVVNYFSILTSFTAQTFLPLSLAPTKEIIFLASAPIIALTYYSVAHFFNYGQSYGMYKCEFRVPVNNDNYREALSWSLYSTLAVLSFGTIILLSQNKRKEFKPHDHLYTHLITFKESKVINLVDEINKMNQSVDIQEMDYFENAA